MLADTYAPDDDDEDDDDDDDDDTLGVTAGYTLHIQSRDWIMPNRCVSIFYARRMIYQRIRSIIFSKNLVEFFLIIYIPAREFSWKEKKTLLLWEFNLTNVLSIYSDIYHLVAIYIKDHLTKKKYISEYHSSAVL